MLRLFNFKTRSMAQQKVSKFPIAFAWKFKGNGQFSLESWGKRKLPYLSCETARKVSDSLKFSKKKNMGEFHYFLQCGNYAAYDFYI